MTAVASAGRNGSGVVPTGTGSNRWARRAVGDVALFDTGTDPAPVLLCLHGIGSCAQGFAAQMAGLGADHRVVVWDAPGYGTAADPAEPLNLDRYVARIADIVTGLGEQVHLVGVSWGSVLAMASALADPSHLASLILIGATRGSGRSPAAAAAMADRLDDLRRTGAAAFAARRAPNLLSRDASPDQVAAVASTMARSVRVAGYEWAARTMADTDLTGRLGAVELPTLLIYGEHDGVTGQGESEAIAAEITGSVVVQVARAGHLANQEQPAAVNAWIAAFVEIVERLHPDRYDASAQTVGLSRSEVSGP